MWLCGLLMVVVRGFESDADGVVDTDVGRITHLGGLVLKVKLWAGLVGTQRL